MARASSTIDRLFARLEHAGTGRGRDRQFVRRYVGGIGPIVTGEGVRELAERVGARAFTTDRGTIAMPDLRLGDPDDLALLFHEHFHAAEGHPRGGEAEERRAQAQEAMVLHLAHDEGITDVGTILQRLEQERDAWLGSAADQPGGTVSGVRAARADRSPRPTSSTARARSRQDPRRGLTASEAVEILLEAGYDQHGIVEAVLECWSRDVDESEREHAYRFAGRTVT